MLIKGIQTVKHPFSLEERKMLINGKKCMSLRLHKMRMFFRKCLSKNNTLTIMISTLDVTSLQLSSTPGRWDPSVLLPLHRNEVITTLRERQTLLLVTALFSLVLFIGC